MTTGSLSSKVPDRAEPARALVNAAFRERGVLPRCRTESSAGASRFRRPTDAAGARHREHGRLAGDYLLFPAARTSRLMAAAIGRIEVRLALNGFASRVGN
ncbi:hypothetical protein GCM10010464_75290 [Pseudonocardia yunnanensis]|uniref:Uncharacterized protein n=1 Tax=Pseudonocardia yunnanensis TaxID=58107 RepID=A0ABW4F5X4_9PSEU